MLVNHKPWVEDRENATRVKSAKGSPPASHSVQVPGGSVPAQEDGGSRAYRGILSYALLAAFVFLSLVGAMLSDQRAAVAAQSPVAVKPSLALLQEGMQGGSVAEERPPEEGGSLTRFDWLDHLPVALVAALVVVGADTVAIVWIRRNRQRSQGSD